MNMLVTGGAGFLGRRVVRSLCDLGRPVRCFLRSGSSGEELLNWLGPARARLVEFFRGDLSQLDDCRRALEGVDRVLHVAAGLSGGPAPLFLNTVIPTRVLVAACLERSLERFVLVSSLGVYGAGAVARMDVLDESCPVDPYPHRRDPYTYSKIVQEQVAWEAHRDAGLPLVVIRPGVIYGPGRGALSNRIGLQLGSRLLRIGGGRLLPYVYVDHCASAVCQAAVVPGIEGEAFNILDDDLPTGRRVLQLYRRAGRPVRSLWLPQCLIGPASSIYEAYSRWSQGQLPAVITRYRSDAMWRPLRFSNAKARARLAWRPEWPFEETFRRSLAPAEEGTTAA
jgi:nucleoside-diphosphate-sugar epimerase